MISKEKYGFKRGRANEVFYTKSKKPLYIFLMYLYKKILRLGKCCWGERRAQFWKSELLSESPAEVGRVLVFVSLCGLLRSPERCCAVAVAGRAERCNCVPDDREPLRTADESSRVIISPPPRQRPRNANLSRTADAQKANCSNCGTSSSSRRKQRTTVIFGVAGKF